MHVEILVIVFILSFLRKAVQESGQHPQLAKNLRTALIISIVSMVTIFTSHQIRVPAMWLSYAVFAWLTYQIINDPVYGVAKATLFSVIPYMLISFLGEMIKLLSDKLFASLVGYIDTGK